MQVEQALEEEALFAGKLKVEARGGAGGEGPAWHPKLGVFMSGNDNLNRLDLEGNLHVERKGVGTNGTLFDARGRLLACEPIPAFLLEMASAGGLLPQLKQRLEKR